MSLSYFFVLLLHAYHRQIKQRGRGFSRRRGRSHNFYEEKRGGSCVIYAACNGIITLSVLYKLNVFVVVVYIYFSYTDGRPRLPLCFDRSISCRYSEERIVTKMMRQPASRSRFAEKQITKPIANDTVNTNFDIATIMMASVGRGLLAFLTICVMHMRPVHGQDGTFAAKMEACEGCKYVWSKTNSVLDESAGYEATKYAFEKVCSDMPSVFYDIVSSQRDSYIYPCFYYS